MNISEIATIARGIKKPPKTKALATLREIIDTGISEHALAELYAYFLPPLPEIPKTLEQWVATAVADEEDVRHYLRHLHSDGRYLVATDGRRAHMVPTALAPGYYDTALVPVLETNTYPELLDRIFPHTGPEYPLISQLLPVRPVVRDIHAYELPNGTLLDTRYVDAATAGTEYVTARMKDDSDSTVKSVMFTRPDGGVAVVMPIRAK